MTILAVDTSCAIASTALICDGLCRMERTADSQQRHAETILPLMEELLTECGMRVQDVDAFAVNVGPGSFTGVRIGVSVINAMAMALDKKIIPVDALRALAQQGWNEAAPLLAIIDARNGNAYAALYQNGETLLPPDAVSIADCMEKLPEGTVMAGDIAQCEPKRYPTARLVGEAAWLLREQAVGMAVPMYLRPSQAERMWAKRQEEKRREG